MSFAEIVLRLGVSFVAWMMLFMHFVMVLVIRLAPCTDGDVSPWRVSLVTALLALGAAAALPYGNGVKGMAGVFRYFALPLAVLVPWAAWIVWPYVPGTLLAGTEVCAIATNAAAETGAPTWQRAWPAVQLVVLGVVGFSGWRAWKQGAQERA